MKDLLLSLRARGVSVEVDGDSLVVRGALAEPDRAALRSLKPQILQLPGLLMSAIDRCCAARGDTDANRAALIVECCAYPAWEQADLLDHFTTEAERWEAATGHDTEYQQHFAAPACAVSSSVAGNKEI